MECGESGGKVDEDVGDDGLRNVVDDSRDSQRLDPRDRCRSSPVSCALPRASCSFNFSFCSCCAFLAHVAYIFVLVSLYIYIYCFFYLYVCFRLVAMGVPRLKVWNADG